MSVILHSQKLRGDIDIFFAGFLRAFDGFFQRFVFAQRGQFYQHRQVNAGDDFHFARSMIEMARLDGVPPNMSVSTMAP